MLKMNYPKYWAFTPMKFQNSVNRNYLFLLLLISESRGNADIISCAKLIHLIIIKLHFSCPGDWDKSGCYTVSNRTSIQNSLDIYPFSIFYTVSTVSFIILQYSLGEISKLYIHIYALRRGDNGNNLSRSILIFFLVPPLLAFFT